MKTASRRLNLIPVRFYILYPLYVYTKVYYALYMFPFDADEVLNSKEILDLNQILSQVPYGVINPMVYDMFEDPRFFRSLPIELKNIPLLAKYLEHSSRFRNIHSNEEPIWGDEVTLEETSHADGRSRDAVMGRILDIKAIKALGINPQNVLYFRRTQPSKVPSPEYYWTNSYSEVLNGLTTEISGSQRETSIILCTTLADLASDSELIRDGNDDGAISVRRVDTGSYDQFRILFVIS